MKGLIREHIVKRFTRSSQWPRFRKLVIDASPVCANCGKSPRFLRRWRLCVHHICPVHLYPHLELVTVNCIVLCNNPRCHLDKGHLGDYRSYNLEVEEDCKLWNEKYQNRPYTKT